MTAKIRVLNDQTVNQIAAGEVIENPASVVKELIENALDSGATKIRLSIRAAGRQLIKVVDNGCGMGADDALLCLERHATSKISQTADLGTISTMGFRGEALAAISAVSKLTLISSEGADAQRVIVEGGRLIAHEVVSRPQGTTVEVRALFYNTPVRRSFQKSLSHDTREIVRVVTLAAMAYPDIAFVVESQGEKLFEAVRHPAQPALEALKERLPAGVSDQWIRVQGELDGWQLWGFIGAPHDARASRRHQYLFINQRPVVSRLVSDLVTEAYGMRLASGRHPCFALHLELPQPVVDVNVHPQKREVRFRDDNPLHRLLGEVIGSVLAPAPFMPVEPVVSETPRLCETVIPCAPSPRIEERASPQQPSPSLPVEVSAVQVLGVLGPYLLLEERWTPPSWSDWLGLIGEGALVCVDSQAAATRLCYDRLLQVEGEPASEGLLVPMQIELSADEASVVEEHVVTCRALGLGIKEIDKQSVSIDALPAAIPMTDVTTLLRDLIVALRSELGQASVLKSQREQIAWVISQRQGAREALPTVAKGERLIAELVKSGASLQLPNGQRVVIVVRQTELERRFCGL